MYSGNREYFAQKRQLIAEAKEKFKNLPVEQSFKYDSSRNKPNGLTFVYEWMDNGVEIIGYGCNADGDACCIKPQVIPGLFVISCDPMILRQVCAIYNYEIIIYDIEYDTNNFAVWELLQDSNVCKPGKLVKIVTHSVENAEKLYNKFKYNHSSYKYVGVSQYFNVCTQIMFELIILNNTRRNMNNLPLDYTVPKTTMCWFDEHLTIYSNYCAPDIPIITFDIETVSSDAHRVPMGDACDDKLFTVSIHHTHTNILYTLIYMPLNLSPNAMKDLILEDGYDVVPDKSVDATSCTNILECFNTERALLVRTMQLLTLKPKLHILYGYNSIGYDIKYLLLRCAFFGVELDNFVWREGYNFGIEQMHLDLFRIIVMRYRFKSYKLDDVSRELLKDSKTGVSAVNLRYTFFRMVKYSKFFKKEDSSAKKPSIKDTLEYNNADTLLVSKLERRTKCIPFIIHRASDCQVPLASMNTNYNKMQFKLWSECFAVGLGLKIYLGTFKQPNAAIKFPVATPYSPDDIMDVNINLLEKLNSNTSETKQVTHTANTRYINVAKKSQFPGGANFCLGEKNVDNVQMYDYVTAYPILMDRKNISDETTTVLPASILVLLYPKIQNIDTFKTYDYLAHNGMTKSETIILYYQYIYDGQYCGGEFPFTMDELKKRQDAPVIVIWEGRRGILSRIIAHFSAVRATTKLKRKALDEIYDMLIDKKNELSAQKILMDRLLMEEANRNKNSNTNTNADVTEDLAFGFDDDNGDNDCMFGIEGADDNDDNDDCMFGIEDADDDNHESDAFGIESDHSEFEFGLDNDDDDDNNGTMVESEVPTGSVVCTEEQQQQQQQSSNFFDNQPEIKRFIIVHGNMCALNDEEFNKESDPIKCISDLADIVALERNNTSNSYNLQKSVVSSIYGCVGKMIVVVAAVITSMTRSTLLASAQFCRRIGCNVLYIDTDSIMVTGCDRDLSAELNRQFPYMEMEMKVARKCMFVKRKTYYKVEDGTFKYGQNVNGPNAWRECVDYFYNCTTITTNPDIHRAFYDFFIMIYKKLHSFESVTPEFLACVTQTIKTKDEYKTMTVAKKFKMYLAEKYPALAGAYKHSIFYFLDNSVLVPCLRPELDIKSKDDVRFVNLFKYYQNMFTTIFNLIKFHIKKNNEPHHVTLSSKYVLLLFLKGFLDAYNDTFTQKNFELDVTLDTNADEVFTEPIHTEVLGDDNDLPK